MDSEAASSSMTDPLEGLEAPAPRRPPRVPEAERTAMAVAALGYGMSSTELAGHFGYDPRTVRAAIRSISDEERHLIGMVAAQELAGLSLAVSRKAALAILGRDLNRERLGKDGKPIPGAYLATENQLAIVAGIFTDKLVALRVPAGLGTEGESGGQTNPVMQLIRNQEELQKVTRGLPAGAKIRLQHTQSVELEAGDETGRPSGPRSAGEPVEATFSPDPDS